MSEEKPNIKLLVASFSIIVALIGACAGIIIAFINSDILKNHGDL